MRRSSQAGLWALIAVFLAAPTPGRAEEMSFSVTGGFATFAIPDHNPVGGYLGIGLTRRLGESAFAVRGAASGGLYSEDGLAYHSHAVIGFSYFFDVLKYVPFANLGVGAVLTGGDVLDTEVAPIVEAGVGIDVLRSRTFSYGAVVRFQTFLGDPALVTAGLRASWRWGFF